MVLEVRLLQTQEEEMSFLNRDWGQGQNCENYIAKGHAVVQWCRTFVPFSQMKPQHQPLQTPTSQPP